MPSDYNPNSIWTSKKKKYEYEPPARAEEKAVPQGLSPEIKPQISGSGFSPKKISIIILGVLAAIALLGGSLYFLNRPASAPAVALEFAQPASVVGGDPFVLSVLYTNSSTVALRNATLSLGLPSGVSASDMGSSVLLGDVAPGETSRKDFTLIATGNSGAIAHVSSTLSYTTDASKKTSFTTSNETSFVIGDPAIVFSIAAPVTVFGGQNFDVTISYTNKTSHSIDGAMLTMQYPPAFTFVSGNPQPAFPGNTIWNFGSLPAGGSGKVVVSGSLSGQNSALYSIAGKIAEKVSGASYDVTSGVTNLTLANLPLGISGVVNRESHYVSSLDDNLEYAITYANTSNVTFRNVSITAALTGSMFDFASAQTTAALKSGTFTWYGANTPELLAIPPGKSGTVTLQIKTKPAFPIKKTGDKNYILNAFMTIQSATVPPGTSASSTVATSSITTQVGGKIAVTATGYHYEKGKIQNSGPYPPQINQPSTYTIHWQLTNYATDVSNVTVSASLQSGTTCTGIVTSTIATAAFCNPATGQVVWTIPHVAADTGVVGAVPETVFQVENTPAVNQVGQTITLLGQTSLAATDDFTGNSLTATADPVRTDIPNDTGVKATDRNVTQ